jgi:hypothetical protein
MHNFMLLSLGGRVKPDHGEKWGIARKEYFSIHGAKASIPMASQENRGYEILQRPTQ